MSSLINIAEIPILIKNRGFLSSLRPAELDLLSPFIRSGGGAVLKEKPFLANIKIIANCGGSTKKLTGNAEVFKKINSIFPDDNGGQFKKKIFNPSLKKILLFYLAENKLRRKRLANLLESDADYNKMIVGNYSFLIFDKKYRRFDLYYSLSDLPQSQEPIFSKFPYNLNVLRLLVRAVFNSSADGAILHASCVERNGLGYAFVGPGNSGKSTVVKMLHPDRILSDDTAIIRKINNAYKIYPTPWWNSYNGVNIKEPASPARLKAVFFIRKAKKTEMRRLGHKESLSMLIYGDNEFQQTGFLDNKTGIKNFYLFSQQLIGDIPFFQLEIRKGHSFRKEFYSLVRDYLKNG